MIRFDRVTVTYPGASTPALENVTMEIEEGHFALVIGSTGAGKSTLLSCVNGLVPHFSGGRLNGTVTVNGRTTEKYRPRDLADVVGYVGQDADASFVADTVEDELAYAMENLGVDPATMRRRVEDVLDTLNLHALRQRAITTLSGGQRQRVAIGAAFTAAPRALVLDEPTSSLDPVSAEEVLSSLARLVHDQGTTILVAEHRLERIVHFADVVVELGAAPGPVRTGPPAEIFATAALAPPVVRLARVAGWSPVPLSVRDARRHAREFRLHLGPPRSFEAARGDLVARAEGPYSRLRPDPSARRGHPRFPRRRSNGAHGEKRSGQVNAPQSSGGAAQDPTWLGRRPRAQSRHTQRARGDPARRPRPPGPRDLALRGERGGGVS